MKRKGSIIIICTPYEILRKERDRLAGLLGGCWAGAMVVRQ
jgi:hypothetical protein